MTMYNVNMHNGDDTQLNNRYVEFTSHERRESMSTAERICWSVRTWCNSRGIPHELYVRQHDYLVSAKLVKLGFVSEHDLLLFVMGFTDYPMRVRDEDYI